MAGESPDRSKQRESSAEPTSGSAGAVPDPRVAASTPRGGVDTATRVFSVRDLKTETPEEPAAAETPEEPAAGETREEPTASGAAEDATASGTAEQPGETGSPDQPDTPRSADEPDEAGKPAGASAAGKATGTAGPESSSEDEIEDAVSATGSTETGKPAKVGAPRTAARTAETEAADETEDDNAAGDTAEAGATDDVAESAKAGASRTAARDGEPAEAGAVGTTGTAAQDGEAAEAGAAASGRAGAGVPEGPEGASERSKGVEAGPGDSEAAGGGDERLRAAVAQWVASADEKGSAADTADQESSADDTADQKSSAADTASAGGGAKERSESDAGAAEAKPDSQTAPKPVSQPASESDSKPDSQPVAKSDSKPVAKSAPKWAAGADEGEGDDPGSGADEGEGDEAGAEKDRAADGAAVDQPTAVFKAPRPKPAVDQPTTMLKLGGATKPKPDADKGDADAEPGAATKPTPDTDQGDADADAEPGAATKPTPGADQGDAEPEADAPAERTSKFVALKPLDEPRPLKPAAKASPEVTALVPQIGPERTTQQPLPPKPPLDLLAELTNTPPPPPTPLRTLGRRIKIWTPLVLLLVVIFAIAQAVRPLPATALTLTAKASYTFEGGKTQLPWPGEGQGWMDADGVGTMGSFGQQKPVAIGSVAKTMTAYIILKDHPMKAGEEGPKIEIDATAEKEGGYDVTGDESTLNTVKAGDQLTEKQALSAVLIPSANNIARLLARWDAGSEAAFVKKMNATAKELGMTRTTYTDPSGLKETTVSTAEDQVKLGRAFVQVPALVAISSAASWTDPSGKYWNNYNELPFKIGAIGIKTGSTTAAGGNLLFASRKVVDGKSVTLVGAILGQHKQKILETVNAVSKTALLAAQDALTSAKILKKGDVVGYVDDKLGGHTPVVITKDVSAVGWAGMTVKLSFVADEVPHTAKAGAQVGTLTVGDGSGSAVKVPVALQTDLVEPGFTDKLTRIS
ncbi:D-alanyl-D-alanine carboxypeptidase [Streptomyces sp. NPDC051677]|uniref:D-alanyl-D-alanine carboxypeptidase n=1 Tax=Streptomyces sp. NPDC051677 TaxID=3365669 RepID=UPI0037D2B444